MDLSYRSNCLFSIRIIVKLLIKLPKKSKEQDGVISVRIEQTLIKFKIK
jgi:hypothetical protein